MYIRSGKGPDSVTIWRTVTWRREALVRTNVSEEYSASIIWKFLLTANVHPRSLILFTMMMEAKR
jgi:hypothetical protein